jgi:ribonuclease J
MIPGNEKAIGAVQDNLVRRGVRVMTDADHMVHVSGHPARDELRRLYRLVRPRYAVPVHGEWRHLSAHAALAKELGATPIMLENGDILGLSHNRTEVIDSAPVGRLALDGNRVVPLQGGVMAARRRMLFNGVVLGSLAADATGRIVGRARVSAPGLFEPEDPDTEKLSREFAASVADLPAPLRRDDAALLDAARAALRRLVGKRLGKKPMVDVHLLRV